MKLEDVKKAIIHNKLVKYNYLTGTPFGCIMRLQHNDNFVTNLDKVKIDSDTSHFKWSYLIEVLDKNSNTVYSFPLDDTIIVDVDENVDKV